MDIRGKEITTLINMVAIWHRSGVLSNSINKVDSSSPSPSINSGGGLKSSAQESSFLIFLLFHKAIRKELDALHRLAMVFATGKRSDIHPLLKWYHFLRSIYKHHSNVEVEVIREIQKLFLNNRDRPATKNFGEGDESSNCFAAISTNKQRFEQPIQNKEKKNEEELAKSQIRTDPPLIQSEGFIFEASFATNIAQSSPAPPRAKDIPTSEEKHRVHKVDCREEREFDFDLSLSRFSK